MTRIERQLKKQARSLIEFHTGIRSNPNRYLVDKDGEFIKRLSTSPLAPWVYDVAKKERIIRW